MSKVCINVIIVLLLLETIDAITPRANKLIQNICNTLHNDTSSLLNEDQQWEIICRELFQSNDDDQNTKTQSNAMNEDDTPSKEQMRKIAGRAIVRVGSGIRTGGIRTGGGSRLPSISRFRNTRTGATISRPPGYQWSRSRLIFLPIATRFLHRSRSSSNRYTTPATGSLTYYYCTSNIDTSVEIQCSSINGDNQCCEDETTRQAFCCGGDIPDDFEEDMNRATQKLARIFYTLAVLTLCMHIFMRRFYR